jgi:N-acetylglucosaminyldiphosphoundecaprenol N-acetyl-beta-D-mannosaminyltransferase
MPKVKILDYLVSDFHSLDADFRTTIEGTMQNDSNIHIITLNMEHLNLAEKIPEFKKILTDAEFLIPDGESICLLARILAKQKIKKIAGIDLAEKLINNYSRIAFLGAEKAVSDSLRNLLTIKYGSKSLNSEAEVFDLNSSKEFFFEHGFYEKNQEESIIERIVNFNPELLLVALGSPAQELLIAKYRHLFKNTVMIGVGGSFDIFAGKLSRAPKLFIKLKLEWFFRILQEPKRLRRFVSNSKNFLLLLLKSFLHK